MRYMENQEGTLFGGQVERVFKRKARFSGTNVAENSKTSVEKPEIPA